MSLKIIRAGLLDTVQDTGRCGHQHLGINPGGAMDRFSASLANALLGKELNAPLLELHFPGPQILFGQAAVICITGADFSPAINDQEVPLHQPLILNRNTVLQFRKWRRGARCYLSLLQNLRLDKWMNSYSTNLKAAAGGYKGRRLVTGDVIEFECSAFHSAGDKPVNILPWKYNIQETISNEIECMAGREWDWLPTKTQTLFLNSEYTISPSSDRMGFRLSGAALEQNVTEQLISSAVNFGTVQLLPTGQLIVLMADHQTTGGYPRLAHVISAHLSKLAQRNANDKIKFVLTDVASAEEKCAMQQNFLSSLRNSCTLKMQNRLNANRP